MANTPDIVGILLASGRGSRFSADGSANKLLADIDGRAVCAAAAETLQRALPHMVAAVPAEASRVGDALRAAGCEVLACDRCAEGMGATIAQAVSQVAAAHHAAGAPMPAWCVMPADMPRIASGTVRRLADAWRALPPLERDMAVFAPGYAGERGHPVLMGPGWTGTLLALKGDAGARKFIEPRLVLVDVDDPGCLVDVDTPEALAAARAMPAPG